MLRAVGIIADDLTPCKSFRTTLDRISRVCCLEMAVLFQQA